MSSFLDSDITFLTGVGENRAKFLQTELGIFTFKDLLYFFPYRYIEGQSQNPVFVIINLSSG